MNFEEFKSTLKLDTPPATINEELKALWLDGTGKWDAAHDLAQKIGGVNGAWIHAYLHREEGDNNNANYWYSKAGKPMSDLSLNKEWESLVREFLK